MGRSKQSSVISIGICAVVLVYVAFQVFPWENHSKVSTQVRNLNNARQLAVACRMYALDHSEHFPDRLEDVVPDYIDKADMDHLLFFSGQFVSDTSARLDWLYFGEGFKVTDAPPLLIASPQPAPTDQRPSRRVIVGPDMTWKVIPENEFERLFEESKKRLPNPDDSRVPAKAPVPSPEPPKD
jgi:hypothetical protein